MASLRGGQGGEWLRVDSEARDGLALGLAGLPATATPALFTNASMRPGASSLVGVGVPQRPRDERVRVIDSRHRTGPSHGLGRAGTGMHTDIAAVEASARRKAYVNIVLPLFIISVIAYLDRVNISYAALTMNAALGFDSRAFGLGAGIFFAGYFLFEIPGALIAERYSPRMWLARIMVTWGLVSALMAFMHTAWQFYLLRFLLGVAEASLYPVMYATCIPRWFPARGRARAIGLLLTSLQISAIIGAPLAGWLVGVPLFGFAGWQVLFLIEAVPAVLFGVIVIFWMADRPRDARWLTEAEKRFLTEQYEQEILAATSARAYTVWQALKDREVLKLCLTYFLWITGFWGFNYWMPTALKDVSGWSNAFIGQMFAVAMLISLLASAYTAHSSSTRNEKRWHGASHMFLAAFAVGAGGLVHAPWVYYIFLVLAAIGTYAPMAVWWAYPTTFLSGPAAAGAVGMINSVGNLGGFVGPYITGWVKQQSGSFTGAMLYLAGSLALAGILILTLKREPPGPQSPA
ncbi:MAG: MFS transporter [Acidobacteriota bacterium]